MNEHELVLMLEERVVVLSSVLARIVVQIAYDLENLATPFLEVVRCADEEHVCSETITVLRRSFEQLRGHSTAAPTALAFHLHIDFIPMYNLDSLWLWSVRLLSLAAQKGRLREIYLWVSSIGAAHSALATSLARIQRGQSYDTRKYGALDGRLPAESVEHKQQKS